MFGDPVVSMILSLGLALLFVTASFHKMRDWRAFTATLKNYELLPQSLVPVCSAVIITTEAGIGAALCIGAAQTPALAAALGLLSVYTAAIGVNLARGRRAIDCGCMGPALRQSLSGWLVVRNLALMAAAALALLPGNARALGLLDLTTVAFGIATCSLLYVAMNHLIANWPRLQQLRN